MLPIRSHETGKRCSKNDHEKHPSKEPQKLLFCPWPKSFRSKLIRIPTETRTYFGEDATHLDKIRIETQKKSARLYIKRL